MLSSKGPSALKEGFVQCGHFADKGDLEMQTSALFDNKNFGFEIHSVSHEQEKGFEPVRTFCGQEGIFS